MGQCTACCSSEYTSQTGFKKEMKIQGRGQEMGQKDQSPMLTQEDKKYFYGSTTGSQLRCSNIKKIEWDGVQMDDLEEQTISPSINDKRRSLDKKRVSVREIIQESIKSQYKFEKILGEGAFGKVKSAHLLTDPTKNLR